MSRPAVTATVNERHDVFGAVQRRVDAQIVECFVGRFDCEHLTIWRGSRRH
jgi:hypothetical protein